MKSVSTTFWYFLCSFVWIKWGLMFQHGNVMIWRSPHVEACLLFNQWYIRYLFDTAFSQSYIWPEILRHSTLCCCVPITILERRVLGRFSATPKRRTNECPAWGCTRQGAKPRRMATLTHTHGERERERGRRSHTNKLVVNTSPQFVLLKLKIDTRSLHYISQQGGDKITVIEVIVCRETRRRRKQVHNYHLSLFLSQSTINANKRAYCTISSLSDLKLAEC